MAYGGSSIVDYLRSINEDSSYAARAKRAAQMGITGYSGTAQQNTQMLNMLRSAQSKPAAPVTPVTPAAPAIKPSLPTDYTSSVGTNKDWYNPDSGQTRQQYENTLSSNTVRPTVTKPTLTAPVNTVQTNNAAVTALDNVSPTRKKVNELIDKLLGGLNSTPYNPNTDTAYQYAAGELAKQANTAYDNAKADKLGNQSGNFNSAALQIAAGAQNDLLGRLPALQADFEDRYNTQQRNKLNDTSNMVNILLGIDEADTAREEKAFEKQLDTIGQYSGDYQAEINRREATPDTADDELIPYLKTARQDKIAAQAAAEGKAAEAKTKAEQQQYEQALNLWKASGTVPNQTIADILGVPVGAKTADYNIDSINATTSRMNAETSKKNAEKGGTEDKSSLTSTQYYNAAKDRLANVIEVVNYKGDVEKVPNMTRQEFELWLANAIPQTEEGERLFDEIYDLLDIENMRFKGEVATSR